MCHKSYTRCLEIYGPILWFLFGPHSKRFPFPFPPALSGKTSLTFFPLSNSETHSNPYSDSETTNNLFSPSVLLFSVSSEWYCLLSANSFLFFSSCLCVLYQRNSSSDNFLHILHFYFSFTPSSWCLNSIVQKDIVLSSCRVIYRKMSRKYVFKQFLFNCLTTHYFSFTESTGMRKSGWISSRCTKSLTKGLPPR